MESTWLYAVLRRLRPQLNTMVGEERRAAFAQMIPLITAPFALIGLIWLWLATDWSLLTSEWLLWLILGVAIFIVDRQIFLLHVQMSEGSTLTVMSSMSQLIVWTGMFLIGPTALWVPILASAAGGLLDSFRRLRRNQNGVWVPLSQFNQELLTNAFVYQIALWIYVRLGGGFPLGESGGEQWLVALVTIVIGALLPAIMLLPTYLYISRLFIGQVTIIGLRSFVLSIAFFTIATAPFAILAVLIFSLGEFGPFLFFLLGVVLVNWLAHSLSQANERSQQRSRELTKLEALGEDLLQAPADASTLADILDTAVPTMFHPFDTIEIRMFSEEDGDDTLQITHPQSQPEVQEEVWQMLRTTPASHIMIPDVILPGARAPIGDAVVVKIAQVVPGQQQAGKLLGGIYLLREDQFGKAADALPVVQALADQIASALYRAQIHAETLAHQLVTQELEIAGRIQASFLPDTVPQPSGWDIAAILEPARQTSGDFYDFIELATDKLGILVADVADKGTGAALYMALSRTLLRTYAMESGSNPAQALGLANHRILLDTQSDQFVTVFYGVLDLATGVLTYANAGQCPPYLFSTENGQHPQALKRTGIPLGMFAEVSWQQVSVPMHPGDVLLLYSDGVTEAQNAEREFFDDERLLAVGQDSRDQSAGEIQTAVLSAIRHHVDTAPQFDDITLMVVRRQGIKRDAG